MCGRGQQLSRTNVLLLPVLDNSYLELLPCNECVVVSRNFVSFTSLFSAVACIRLATARILPSTSLILTDCLFSSDVFR